MMQRKKRVLAGVVTALITVASLNLIFGQRFRGHARWQHNSCCRDSSKTGDRITIPVQ